jgi:hypothetical protein
MQPTLSFHPERRGRGAPLLIVALVIAAALAAAWVPGCREGAVDPAPGEPGAVDQARGEEFLASALDEIEAIADAAPGSVPAVAADTTYVYGEILPGGYGAVVTERHAYPKGILLITVRRSYGTELAHLVTDTRRYTSEAAFLADSAEQTNRTEVYGLTADTIVTYVDRNGLSETYTFRLPVVSKVTNPADGSVRVTTRFADAGAVVTEVRDGAGLLVSRRTSSGAADGAILSTILYADSTWRSTRTIGQADGSVLRDVTSGP